MNYEMYISSKYFKIICVGLYDMQFNSNRPNKNKCKSVGNIVLE